MNNQQCKNEAIEILDMIQAIINKQMPYACNGDAVRHISDAYSSLIKARKEQEKLLESRYPSKD